MKARDPSLYHPPRAYAPGDPMPAKRPAKRAKPKARATRPPAASEADLRDLVKQLAVLAAANNIMAQTAFLTMERLRISSEVVDEAVTNDFGSRLFETSQRLVDASDRLILDLLDRAGAEGPEADVVRTLLHQRAEFKNRAMKPKEQPRLVEALERMYR